MTGLAEAIANTVQAAQQHDSVKLGTSIVDIVANGVNRCPEIHGHGSNLDFRKNLFFTMNQLNGIFDHHMVAAVS